MMNYLTLNGAIAVRNEELFCSTFLTLGLEINELKKTAQMIDSMKNIDDVMKKESWPLKGQSLQTFIDRTYEISSIEGFLRVSQAVKKIALQIHHCYTLILCDSNDNQEGAIETSATRKKEIEDLYNRIEINIRDCRIELRTLNMNPLAVRPKSPGL